MCGKAQMRLLEVEARSHPLGQHQEVRWMQNLGGLPYISQIPTRVYRVKLEAICNTWKGSNETNRVNGELGPMLLARTLSNLLRSFNLHGILNVPSRPDVKI
ncbi:hypothetical protein VNO77_03567 [Canavalia gladiata]|uniref:Uncharacterized protein n=1 Tax=Canavalia gladiata TaxID=3824 RepID=A0AAN9MV36_CANGL